MLSVEDALNSLNWATSIGGIDALVEISENNLKIVSEWISNNDNFEFLAKDPETLSCTSICLVPKDPWFKNLDLEKQTDFMKKVCGELEVNEAGYDLNSYKTAPPGIRIWGGSTVTNENVKLVLPWIDWAYETVKSEYN
jgi:phosphoserine aminotransferase